MELASLEAEAKELTGALAARAFCTVDAVSCGPRRRMISLNSKRAKHSFSAVGQSPEHHLGVCRRPCHRCLAGDSLITRGRVAGRFLERKLTKLHSQRGQPSVVADAQ